jgi:hypothetical protein
VSLLKQWLWPDVSLRRQAQGAIQEAFWITVALSAYKLIWVLILFLRDSDAGLNSGLNLGGLVEGLCFALFALGLHFRSRIAAVLSFSFYVLDFIYVFVMVRPHLPILPALIALGLFAGVRGTFAYHRLPPKPQDLPTIEQSFRSVKPAPENQANASDVHDLG